MDSDVYIVWEDTNNRIASFHPIEMGNKKEFKNYDYFMSYLVELQNRGYRFQ